MIRNRLGYNVDMDYLRHLIDEGKLYFYVYRVRKSTADRVLRLKTGANYVWFSGIIGSGLATPYEIYENVTINTAGTPQILRNAKRRIGDDKCLSRIFTFGSTPGQASSNKDAVFGYEFLPNTEYIIHMLPDAETDTTLDITLTEERI